MRCRPQARHRAMRALRGWAVTYHGRSKIASSLHSHQTTSAPIGRILYDCCI